MSKGTKAASNLISKFKNDENFGTLDLRTLVYIVVTVTVFQLGENRASVFTYLALGIMAVGLLIIPTDQMAFAYIVLAASNRLLNFGSNIPALPFISVAYIIREYVMKKGYKKSRFDTSMMVVLAVYMFFSLRYIFSTFFLKDFIQASKLFFSFPMLVDVFRKCNTKEEAKRKFNHLVFYMSIGIVLTSFISMFFSSAGSEEGRFALSSDSGANILGIYASVAISAIVVVVMSENTSFFKQVTALTIIPMAYIGLLTQSRTFVVLSLIIIVWFLFVGLGNEQARKNTGIFAVIMIFVVVLFMIFGRNTELYNLFDTIIDRFLHPRYDDVTGGRSRLAKAYLTTIFSDIKYMLIGSDGSLRNPGGGVVAHNMYIEVLYDGGLVGFGIVTAIYIVFSKRIAASFKKCGFEKASLAGALPLIICLVGGLSSHTILGAMPTNEFFIGICSIYYFSRASSKKSALSFGGFHYQSQPNLRYTNLERTQGE